MTDEQSFVESPDEVQRRRYFDLTWTMSKEQMFKELMRVHTASSSLLGQAQATIDDLKAVIAQYETDGQQQKH